MIGPFHHVPIGWRSAVARSSALLTVALLVVITILGAPLRSDLAPLGIISLQFAASPEVATSMLDSWAGVPLRRLLWAHGLDLVFPVAYALAVGTAAVSFAGVSQRAMPAAALAAGSVLVAAVADQIENVAMLLTILRGPGWDSVLPTLAAATVKFAGLGLAVGSLAVAAIVAARTQRTSRAPIA